MQSVSPSYRRSIILPHAKIKQLFSSLSFYALTFIFRDSCPPSHPHISAPTTPAPPPSSSVPPPTSASPSTSPSPPASPPHSGSTSRSCRNIPAPAELLEDNSGNCRAVCAGFVGARCRRCADLGERYGRAPRCGTRGGDRRPNICRGTGT